MSQFQKICIIDNFDSFTFNLVDYFRQLDCDVEVYRNDVAVEKIEEVNPDLLVLSPGPSIPKKAGNLMAIIAAYEKKYPIFGVCLGHEALIEHFGGSLKLVKPVHGKSTMMDHDGKTIFTGLENPFLGGRYHSLAANEVPDCFEVSATSDDICMAIRHHTLPIESVQFHPESILTMKGDNGFNMIENVVEGRFANIEK